MTQPTSVTLSTGHTVRHIGYENKPGKRVRIYHIRSHDRRAVGMVATKALLEEILAAIRRLES